MPVGHLMFRSPKEYGAMLEGERLSQELFVTPHCQALEMPRSE